ncbi:MAG: hypothetical protein KME05_03100 [Gloeocapsa sp. UFS-A4-WI-NPMV-4B04]|jgi:hypothetical protein|nr:hypothetical protein [Gloeocapsa sp. UFS-A4-WI-NPMV-4B04]
MDKKYQNRKQAGLVETMCASLLVLPAIFTTTSVVLARPLIEADKHLSQVPSSDSSNQAPSNTSTSPLNPRPSIFNEPPYNRSQGTSPTDSNAAPTTQPTPGAITPPLPEQQTPSAIATPVDGKINIKLINTTNSVVSYQVIGDTNQRFLSGDSNVTLQNIQTPVTVTLSRQDNGLVKVSPQATLEGLLEVTLDKATSLNEDISTMIVQQDGRVLLN